ncbi:MAG: DUF6442 family protein [Ruminococcus sp.]|nr:DUF6442 family protein [Ruminococcus sp.]
MNKQEILEMAVKENEYSYDEREEAIIEKGAGWAMVIGMLVCFILVFLGIHIFDAPEVSVTSLLMFLSMDACNNFFIFSQLKKRKYLVKGIINGVEIIIFAILLIYLLCNQV